MIKQTKWIVFLGLLLALISKPLLADRLKDMTSIAGVRSNQLVGYGVAVGLAGTGDGQSGSNSAVPAIYGVTIWTGYRCG